MLDKISRIQYFMSKCKKKMLCYHMDADGVCSASLFLKFFRFEVTNPMEGPVIDSNFMKKIKSGGYDLVAFLDIPVDQEYEKVNYIAERLRKKIIVIDHHPVQKNLDSKDIVHINPRMRKKDTYVSASYVVYRTLENMGFFVKPFSWIAYVGVVGDHAMNGCRDLEEECLSNYKELLSGNFKETPVFTIAQMISSAITLKGSKGASFCLNVILGSENWRDIFREARLERWREVVNHEVKRIVDDFEKRKKESEGGVVEYEIKSKMNITSIIANVIFEKYPEKTIILRKRADTGWKVSMRSSTHDVGFLASAVSKGIGSGGGHKNAAGAFIRDYRLFIKRIKKLIQSSTYQ